METKLKPNEYQCEGCGKVYEYGWSYEEAKEEAIKNFGKEDVSDMAVICDDCYKKMVPTIFN